MNHDERRIAKRMIDQEHLEAVNAPNHHTRMKHANRGDAIKSLMSRFAAANQLRADARRKRRMTAESEKRHAATFDADDGPNPKRVPIPNAPSHPNEPSDPKRNGKSLSA